jgi:hypothetical protein
MKETGNDKKNQPKGKNNVGKPFSTPLPNNFKVGIFPNEILDR